jgi:hypothetical protein
MRGTEHGREGTLTVRSRLSAMGRDAGKDALGGLVASVVLIANIVSFGALMFPGDLSAGIPVAIWSMLIGGCVGGAWIAVTTSLPPLATGIDGSAGMDAGAHRRWLGLLSRLHLHCRRPVAALFAARVA